MSSSSSGLKCTEHIEEVFPGVQCLRVWFTNFIHSCLLRRTSGLGLVIRRNLMHADSFLFISRVAASKNHTFFYHFLFNNKALPRIFANCFARCHFLTSRCIFGHIWPSGGLMRMIGENIDKTAFTFKKKGFNISEIFSKVSSWKIWKSTKRKQIEGLGAQGSYCSKKISSSKKICWYFLLKFLVSALIDIINMPQEFQKNRWSRSP